MISLKNVSCVVERKKDGSYQVNCEVADGNGKKISSTYQGKDLFKGLDDILDDVTNQISEGYISTEPESKPKEESLEDKVTRLESLVKELQAENNALNSLLDDLMDKEEEEDSIPEEDNTVPQNTSNIEDAIKYFNNIFKFTDDKKKQNKNPYHEETIEKNPFFDWFYF